MKSGKRKNKVRKTGVAPVVEPQEQNQEIVEVKPEEILRRWIHLRHELESGKELNGECPWFPDPGYKSDKAFMEETQISEVIKKIGPRSLVNILLDIAYGGGFENPYEVADVIDCEKDIIDELTDYFERTVPERWNMAFAELIVAISDSWMFYECCEWRKDQEKARRFFEAFVNGQVSSTLHSDRLYIFLFRLFFGHGSAASFVLAHLDYHHDNDQEMAQLMKGLIAKGKQGMFIWEFEKYVPVD
jgi:hypothetical protein